MSDDLWYPYLAVAAIFAVIYGCNLLPGMLA